MWFPGLYRIVAWRMNRAARRGDAAKAERIAASYARWRPRDPQAWSVWAWAVMEATGLPAATLDTPTEVLQRGEEILRQGLRVHPNSVELSDTLAHNLSGQGRTEEAEQIWNRVRVSHPDSPVPLTGLAWHAVMHGRYEQTRDLAEQALKQSPDADTLENLATALLLVPGQRERYMELLERAVNLTKNPRTHVLLALLIGDRDPARAREHLAKASRSLPRGPEHLEREISRTKALLADYPPPDH